MFQGADYCCADGDDAPAARLHAPDGIRRGGGDSVRLIERQPPVEFGIAGGGDASCMGDGGEFDSERAQLGEYQAALKQWMKDTTEWAQKKKQDPGFSEPRPKRPVEPTYSSDSCANVG